MTNVHHLPQADLLGEPGPAAVDDAAVLKAARQAFDEAADTGCSFADCLAAVFAAGVASITGAPKRSASRKAALPPCPYDEIVATYHAHLPELSRVGVQAGKLWEKRKELMRELWRFVLTSKIDGVRRAETKEDAMRWIARYFETARSNKHIMGEKRSEAYKDWVAGIDYLLSPNGMRQVMEQTKPTKKSEEE